MGRVVAGRLRVRLVGNIKLALAMGQRISHFRHFLESRLRVKVDAGLFSISLSGINTSTYLTYSELSPRILFGRYRVGKAAPPVEFPAVF